MKKKMIIFLLIIVGTTSAGWYGFNYYTEKLFDELVANMSIPNEITNPLSKNESGLPEKAVSLHETTQTTQINNQELKETATANQTANQKGTKQVKPKQTTKNNTAQNQTQTTKSSPPKLVVTEQEVQQKSEQVSKSDKLTAAKIILSNLTKADIDRIMEMSTGGFTANEKEQVKSMLLSRLSKEDFQVIYSLVVKYR